MKSENNTKGVVIIGTQARGGIRAVIENHISAGVYDGYTHYFIASHDEASNVKKIGIALMAILKLLGLLIRGKVSILHLHGSYNAETYKQAIFVFLGRLFRRKVIFHLHGSEFAKIYESSGAFYCSVVRYILNKADNVFVLSNYWKDYVGSISTNKEIMVINNFPSPEFESLFDQRDFSPKEIVEMLFLGLIGDRKGIFDLVDAVAILKLEGVHNFRITVGGNGQVDRLRDKISEKGLDDYFNVIGWVTGDQKHQLIKDSNLLLLPSHNEGLPIAILEALSSGLAVLSTKVGGIPDAISSDKYGLLVDPEQPEQLANAIKQYLETDGIIGRVAKNARELYDAEYSSTANVDNIRHVYKTLLNA